MTKPLSDKQKTILTAIGTSQYGDGPGSHIWSWDVCNNRSDASVLGSLIRRQLVGAEGDRKEATCWLTEEGVAAFYDLNPKPAPAPEPEPEPAPAAPAKKKAAAQKKAAPKKAAAKKPAAKKTAKKKPVGA